MVWRKIDILAILDVVLNGGSLFNKDEKDVHMKGDT